MRNFSLTAAPGLFLHAHRAGESLNMNSPVIKQAQTPDQHCGYGAVVTGKRRLRLASHGALR